MSKHQIRSGDGRWEGRRGVGRLSPRRETKTKGRNGDRERKMREEVTSRRNSSHANGGGEAEQSGAFYDSAKGGIEHVHVDGKSQLPLSTSRRCPCTDARPTETCVAPVDATRDFLYFLRMSSVGGWRYAAKLFLLFCFPCSADHERDWPPCKVLFSGLATNTLNVRNHNNYNYIIRGDHTHLACLLLPCVIFHCSSSTSR